MWMSVPTLASTHVILTTYVTTLLDLLPAAVLQALQYYPITRVKVCIS